LEYKIDQKDQLVSELKRKGLFVREISDEDGNFVDVYESEFRVGSFEEGNESWELVCYSNEAEQAAKRYGLMDLIKYYWPWF